MYRNGSMIPVLVTPRNASTFKIIAIKGAIAATYPPSISQADLLRDHLEATVIEVASNNSVRLAMLSAPLQNQAGLMVYQVEAWGFLPWLTGFMLIAITTAIWKRITDSFDQALKRIAPKRRKNRDHTPESS
jgi:hypothetical protein